jgi:hypothetical protein
MIDEKERLRISGQIHGPGVYTRALEAARNELAGLLQQRQEIDKRVMQLQRTVDALLAVCEEQGVQLPSDLLPPELESPTPIGFTDAVRNILRERGLPMGPIAVRDALVDMGIDMNKYSNPMVPVHNTLKRLCERGEVARTPLAETGGFQYVWFGPMGRALALDPIPTFGPNRNAIANLTNKQLADMSQKKR